jgi:hypothetical protein
MVMVISWAPFTHLPIYRINEILAIFDFRKNISDEEIEN